MDKKPGKVTIAAVWKKTNKTTGQDFYVGKDGNKEWFVSFNPKKTPGTSQPDAFISVQEIPYERQTTNPEKPAFSRPKAGRIEPRVNNFENSINEEDIPF